MSYTKHVFNTGDILYAADLNVIDAQVERLSALSLELSKRLLNLQNASNGALYEKTPLSSVGGLKLIPNGVMPWAELTAFGGSNTVVDNNLVPAQIKEIVPIGKNIMNKETFTSNLTSYNIIRFGFVVPAGTKLTVSVEPTPMGGDATASTKYWCRFYRTGLSNLAASDPSPIAALNGKVSFSTTLNYDCDRIYLYAGSNATDSKKNIVEFKNLQVEVGTSVTAYEPYTEYAATSFLPASAISQIFSNGMKAAGNAYDEINFETKVATERVGIINLANLTWSYDSSISAWTAPFTASKVAASSEASNIAHGTYTSIALDTLTAGTSNGIALNASGIVCKNGSTTKAPTGNMHYELLSPITYSVPQALGLNINVENGMGLLFRTDTENVFLYTQITYSGKAGGGAIGTSLPDSEGVQW